MAGFASLEMNRTTAPTTSPTGRIPSPANAALQQGPGPPPTSVNVCAIGPNWLRSPPDNRSGPFATAGVVPVPLNTAIKEAPRMRGSQLLSPPDQAS
jgi:hypothetical protein